MSSVTTREEQQRAGKVVRKVGGYNELFRLARERSGTKNGRFYRDDKGRYQVCVAEEPLSRGARADSRLREEGHVYEVVRRIIAVIFLWGNLSK